MSIRSFIKSACLVSVFTLCFILPASAVNAEVKTFIKEYTYQAGDEDSKNSCRVIALREVKRLLLEELGTYLEAETEVKNFQLTKDQIVTLTAGIVGTELIEDKWDGKAYWLKAKISANPQDVTKAISTLRKDRAKTKELEELRKKSDALLKENERLTKKLKTARGAAQKKAAQAYKQNISNLNATEWFEKGYELVISGNYIEAEKAFSKAIALNPRLVEAHYNRGLTYGNLGNHQQTIEDYNKAIELNPNYAEAYNNRGVSYDALGNHQQAIKDFNKAISLNPQDAKAYNNRGLTYGNLGNHQQEIEDFNKAISLNPQAAEAYNNRGVAYRQLGNHQQTIEDYNKAIELNPNYAEAYNNRGLAYDTLGNYQQAIKDYNKAIELNSQDAEAYNNRGIAYGMLRNYQQAIKDFNKAISLNPQDAKAYNNRGLTYGNLGNHQQEIEDIKIAARLGLQDAQNFLRSQGIEWCVITGEKQGQNHRNKEGHVMERANKFLSRYFQPVAFNL